MFLCITLSFLLVNKVELFDIDALMSDFCQDNQKPVDVLL
jgi:hypothetical protein